MSFELTPDLREKLDSERIVWLTTVSPMGQPMPRPVWFLWDGEALVVYTSRETAKLRHIDANPRVTVHFNADRDGSDVVVLIGRAERVADPVPPSRYPGYLDKYSDGLSTIGYTVEKLDLMLPAALRVVPHRSWSPPEP
ncbi:TIGR03667 family PPOX class F420-dependent oxidoreductase [Allosalinactinospora lopnorensis]|uniref:TIGR03667 family PPOX class F420-dependent oxidoreductase n=1 Tax=Allosalinactinospora lopnorensis TaxID=1352348 RepID=UPI000623FFB7|nr:TIGR03667 family PPOX class F420-dependent oxidoreductase [Allosalinactinospora lopnorensis]